MSDRELSGDELKSLIHRAAEIDKQEQLPDANGKDAVSSYKLDEAISIAAEIGVSEWAVLKAAAERNLVETEGRSLRFIGAPLSAFSLDVLEGSCSDSQLKELLPTLPGILSHAGDGYVQEGYLHWTADNSFSNQMKNSGVLSCDVKVSSRNIEIICKEKHGQTAAGLFGGLIGGTGCGVGFGVGFGVGMGVLNSPLFAILFSGSMIVSSIFLARFSYRKLLESRKKFLSESTARIRDYLGRHLQSGAVAESQD
ncbi:hypothetical protein [Spirochaeta dissipatitropha]